MSLTIEKEGALDRLNNHDRVVRGIGGFLDRYNIDRGVCVCVCVCVCVWGGWGSSRVLDRLNDYEWLNSAVSL